MRTRLLLPMIMGIILLSLFASPVSADGIIIPLPPILPPDPIHRPMAQLVIRYHHVTVSIEDQIAVTHVDQVFYNPNDWAVEGIYVFPLPMDAVVSNFILWIDGEPVEGKVLDAEQARQIYEQIVREMRDPALLEYLGRGAFQASIFPIPPQGERRIEIEYTQALTSDNGLIRYIYPLNTEKFSMLPLESVRVSVQVDSEQPIRAAYSPSHLVDIFRESDTSLVASYEASDVTPDKDFALYYSVGEAKAFHLLSYRDPEDPYDTDGFFMLLLAPSPEESEETISKDILLVLDRSGSMEGEKFRQAQSALQYILNHLNEDDRFYLATFSTGIDTFADELLPVSKASDAADWVARQSAAGSTDINRALLEAISIADRERPTYLIFLTDGLPTEGITDSQLILNNLESAAPDNIRLFAFGVGYDVDTLLLDTLSQEHHGLTTYVQPGEALDEVLSGFYARISTPVLTNIDIDFDDISTYDIYPSPLPDLFSGSQVIVLGRYRKGGMTDITLTGDVNGVTQRFEFPDQRFSMDSRGGSDTLSGLPRLWATRKIGYLLSYNRLYGPDLETIDQIVKLSIRYGIVTEYTSYLVTETMPLGAENMERLSDETYAEMMEAPTVVSGQAAVEKAVEEGDLSQAVIVPSSSIAQEVLKIVWSRSFIFSNGVWIDTSYDPDGMEPMQVSFLSDEYFALAESRPDVGAGLALGDRVLIVVDGLVYEVVIDGETDETMILPETVATEAQEPVEIIIQETGEVELAPQQEDTPTGSTASAETPEPAEEINPMDQVVSPVRYLILGGAAIFGLVLLLWFFTRKRT